jgi:hypothetical protein
MSPRAGIVSLLLLLGACVPFKETYFDAVNGIPNPYGPRKNCPRDRYHIGPNGVAPITILAFSKDGKPQVEFWATVWKDHTLTFANAELRVRSLGIPQVEDIVPIQFYEWCNAFRSESCVPKAFPLVGPNFGDARTSVATFRTRLALPESFSGGFQLNFVALLDGTTIIPIGDIRFETKTGVVTRGPLGCE